MKQVLLAINKDLPSKKAYRYAVELSQRIRAELSILRFIKKDRLKSHLKSPGEKALRLGRFLEDSFADVAFAEEGVAPNLFREMLADCQNGVTTKITVSEGDPETDLGFFVDSHHDVVLTILDSPGNPGQAEKLKKSLGVPLVVIKPVTP